MEESSPMTGKKCPLHMRLPESLVHFSETKGQTPEVTDISCSEVTEKVWRTTDLCSQCASVDFSKLVKLRDGHTGRARYGMETSSCPLCRFFAGIAFSQPPSEQMLKDVKYRLAVVKPGNAFHQMLPTRFQFPRNHPNVIRLDVAVSDTHWLPGEIFILPAADASENTSYSLDGRLLCPHWIDFSVLSGWISYCQSHHEGICDPLDTASANAGQENLRQVVRIKVIDCETRAIITAPENCSYVALSYVWGSPSTSQSTEEEITVGVLPGSVPTTVNDAVKVVLGLKLRYLWVDKYCIDQSDETEMLQQLSNMDMVYNRAVATIVAVAGEDSGFGLPGVDRRSRDRQISINLDGRVWISSSQNPAEIIDKSKWSTRAWTYQEGVLSTRRLIFTNEQVYYECNAMAHRETVRYGLPENLDDAIEDELKDVLGDRMGNEVEGEDEVEWEDDSSVDEEDVEGDEGGDAEDDEDDEEEDEKEEDDEEEDEEEDGEEEDEEEDGEEEDEGGSEWDDVEENEKDYYYKVEDNTKYHIQGVVNGGFGLHQRGLDSYIEEYSKRSLSWQSDIIKAMLGVFQVFAHMPTPTRQYWGVPMDYRYNVDVHFKFEDQHCRPPWPSCSKPVRFWDPSKIFPGYLDAAFAKGLCWELDEPALCREGFPSWSWAGWLGPLPDTTWGYHECLTQNEDPKIKISLQMSKGAYDRIDESIIAKVALADPTTIGYTQVLRIEAWAVQLRFEYHPNGVGEAEAGWQPDYYPTTQYYASAKTSRRSGKTKGTLYVPLVLTCKIEENDELHTELREKQWDCIVVSRTQSFALVLRNNGTTAERVGHIKLEQSYLKTKDALYGLQHTKHDRGDFLNRLKRVRFTVLLA